MNTHYQQVKEFMQTMDQEVPSGPCLPSLAVRKLRAKTILEEAIERINALGLVVIADSSGELLSSREGDIRFDDLLEFNPAEFLDGVCDAEYFDLGSLIALGITEEAYMKHFEKVHQANMGKLWTPEEVYLAFFKEASIEDLELLQSHDHFTRDNHFFKHKGCRHEWEGPEGDCSCKKCGKDDVELSTNDRCWLVKDKDGKVIKPPSFKAPGVEL